MSMKIVVSNALQEAFGVIEKQDGVLASTHCLYPSGGFVRVMVRGGENTFVVSDEGAGVHQIEAAGAAIENVDSQISALLKPLGLKSVSGVIRSPACSLSTLPYAVASVANASSMVADWLFSTMKIRPHAEFKAVVTRYLEATFPTSVRAGKIVGGSNKEHTFDSIIFMPGGKRIVVDPVIHDMKSINARVVANMDVQRAGYEDVEQRIVYDDSDDWKASEINILQFGATVIPFSKAPKVLSRMAGAA